MERSADDLSLLFLCQLVEVYRITRYTDSKIGISLGVFISLNKRFLIQNIYIEVVRIIREVSVKHGHKVCRSLLLGLSERIGNY